MTIAPERLIDVVTPNRDDLTEEQRKQLQVMGVRDNPLDPVPTDEEREQYVAIQRARGDDEELITGEIPGRTKPVELICGVAESKQYVWELGTDTQWPELRERLVLDSMGRLKPTCRVLSVLEFIRMPEPLPIDPTSPNRPVRYTERRLETYENHAAYEALCRAHGQRYYRGQPKGEIVTGEDRNPRMQARELAEHRCSLYHPIDHPATWKSIAHRMECNRPGHGAIPEELRLVRWYVSEQQRIIPAEDILLPYEDSRGPTPGQLASLGADCPTITGWVAATNGSGELQWKLKTEPNAIGDRIALLFGQTPPKGYVLEGGQISDEVIGGIDFWWQGIGPGMPGHGIPKMSRCGPPDHVLAWRNRQGEWVDEIPPKPEPEPKMGGRMSSQTHNKDGTRRGSGRGGVTY